MGSVKYRGKDKRGREVWELVISLGYDQETGKYPRLHERFHGPRPLAIERLVRLEDETKCRRREAIADLRDRLRKREARKTCPALRYCPRCETYLPATSAFFSKSAHSSSGFASYCKKCFSEYHADRARRARIARQRRAYRVANKDRIREYEREWARRNAETVREKVRRWSRMNPDKVRELGRRRRAERAAAAGSHTEDDVRAQYERQRGICYGVGCSASLDDGYHVDHFVPLNPRPGDPVGTDDASNIVLMCPTCNMRKSNIHPMDYSGQLF